MNENLNNNSNNSNNNSNQQINTINQYNVNNNAQPNINVNQNITNNTTNLNQNITSNTTNLNQNNIQQNLGPSEIQRQDSITNEQNVQNLKKEIKLEFVNPVNPSEILELKEDINQKQEQPKDELKNDEAKVETKEKPEKRKKDKKPKDKKMILLISVIVVLVILAICLAIILFTPKKEKEQKTPTNAPTEQAKITLSDIGSNLQNSSFYKLLQLYYTVSTNVTTDSITFTLTSPDLQNPITREIIFSLKDRNLVTNFNINEDNTTNLYAFYIIADSIAQFNKQDVDLVANYLYTVQNNYNFNTAGITTVANIDNFEVSINIDTNIDASSINNISYSTEELMPYKDQITNLQTELKKANLVMYTTSNAASYNILIGERKELTNSTYNTIINLINVLYPEEIEDFKSKFPSLTAISFDKYKISLDPILEGYPKTYTQYSNNYKFILIEITKEA